MACAQKGMTKYGDNGNLRQELACGNDGVQAQAMAANYHSILVMIWDSYSF
jgi:hypothetical protein